MKQESLKHRPTNPKSAQGITIIAQHVFSKSFSE